MSGWYAGWPRTTRLACRCVRPGRPRFLIAQRRVLPILDALDEPPEQVRPKILARLNEVASDPLVLTCRTAEYEAAVSAPGEDALTGGAVIEPDPVDPRRCCQIRRGLPPAAGWCRLVGSAVCS